MVRYSDIVSADPPLCLCLLLLLPLFLTFLAKSIDGPHHNFRYRRILPVEDAPPPPQKPHYLPGSTVVLTLFNEGNGTAYDLTLDEMA